MIKFIFEYVLYIHIYMYKGMAQVLVGV